MLSGKENHKDRGWRRVYDDNHRQEDFGAGGDTKRLDRATKPGGFAAPADAGGIYFTKGLLRGLR